MSCLAFFLDNLSVPTPVSGCSPSQSVVVASAGSPISSSTAQLLVTNSGNSNCDNDGAKATSLAFQLQHPQTLTASPLSIANGISPHFPMFYHHPYIPAPAYQVPTTSAQGADEGKQIKQE